jgi:5-methylcytosine-specific restriction endonuclease McrA
MALPDKSFLAPRRCLREPIAEIFQAAELLERAVDAHLDGNRQLAAELIAKADQPAIRDWVSPLLGSTTAFPDRSKYVRYRPVPNAPPVLKQSEKEPVRMPTELQKAELIRQQGRNCAFCGIPLVSVAVRRALVKTYPAVSCWGPTNLDCHAALLCMWLQFDHVLPHSRGGKNDLPNILLTCSGCNYGRMSYTLEEVGLEDPRTKAFSKTGWRGLEQMLV